MTQDALSALAQQIVALINMRPNSPTQQEIEAVLHPFMIRGAAEAAHKSIHVCPLTATGKHAYRLICQCGAADMPKGEVNRLAQPETAWWEKNALYQKLMEGKSESWSQWAKDECDREYRRKAKERAMTDEMVRHWKP